MTLWLIYAHTLKRVVSVSVSKERKFCSFKIFEGTKVSLLVHKYILLRSSLHHKTTYVRPLKYPFIYNR